MKRLKFLFILILVSALVSFASIEAKADFGDFNDYSSDDWSTGGSDYNDWDYGSGNSDDWDSDDSWDTNRSRGGDFSCDNLGLDELLNSWNQLVFVFADLFGDKSGVTGYISIILIVGLIVFLTKRRKAKRSYENKPNRANGSEYDVINTPSENMQIQGYDERMSKEDILSAIKETDPNFSITDFESFAKRCFIDMQEAWSNQDLSPLQVVLHPNIYEQTEKQIEIKKKDGIINKLERISVNNIAIVNFEKDNQFEKLTVDLKAQMVDYQVDIKSNTVVAGSKDRLWKLKYRITFVRSLGSKTMLEKEGTSAMICPNCCAHIPTAAFGKCEYCGSIVTTGKYSWVIIDITRLSRN